MVSRRFHPVQCSYGVNFHYTFNNTTSSFEWGQNQVNNTATALNIRIALLGDGRGFTVANGGDIGTDGRLILSGDVVPRAGAFVELINDQWAHFEPRIATDLQGRLHVLSHIGTGDSVQRVYLRYIPVYGDAEFVESATLDQFYPATLFGDGRYSCVRGGGEIVTSHVSNRVAVLWLSPGSVLRPVSSANNDLFMLLSEDGGDNWEPPVNLTQFTSPDTALFQETGNWRCANRDTLRAIFDVSAVFDNNDQLNVVFTTAAYYHWINGVETHGSDRNRAIVWHWQQETNSFLPVSSLWYSDYSLRPGVRGDQTAVAAPSFSYDRENEQLYCAFSRLDTSQYSYSLYSYDVFLCELDVPGQGWSAPINVTETEVESSPSQLWAFQSEEDVCVSANTYERQLFLQYVFDRYGEAVVPEPFGTEYEVRFQRVSLESLNFTDYSVPPVPLHVNPSHCDSILTTDDVALVTGFSLAAYPNPFNSSVTLEYVLSKASEVDLRIFDVQGRVTTLLVNSPQLVGTHRVTWSAYEAASGVYFARIKTSDENHTVKLLLLK